MGGSHGSIPCEGRNMANRDKILDGLAWAGISEAARVAKIAAILVKEQLGTYTKTRIKDAVKDTSPPYGRGKAICEQVTVELERQLKIHNPRREARIDFTAWLAHRAKPATRLNDAYAFRFDRPTYDPYHFYPGSYTDDWNIRQAYDETETGRDKGDECIAITHWQEHVVALVETINGDTKWHIATRLHTGDIVRTYLRSCPTDLAQVAISLGGPKVKAAYARGIRVTTDWVARKTTVHYTDRREIVLPWRSVRWETRNNNGHYDYEHTVNTIIHPDGRVTDEPEKEEEVEF